MTNKRIFKINSPQDLERCFPVIKELRAHLTFEQFLKLYNEARAQDGYELIAIEIDGKIQAVMGYRFLTDFVRGKHLYIDDLVTTEAARSQGLGAELLKYAEKVAKENGGLSLRLCAVLENEKGIRFYDKNGWKRRAYAFTKSNY